MGDTLVNKFDTTVATATGYGTGPGAALFVACIDGASNQYNSFNQGIPNGSAYADLTVGGTDMVRNVACASGFASTAIGSNADQLDNGFSTIRYLDVTGKAAFHGYTPQGVNKYLPDCWDSDGFWTVSNTEVQSDAAAIILGNQIQAKCAQFFPRSSTGNQSITGVGFQPDIVIFIGCINGQTDTGTGWNAYGTNMAFGVMDSSGNQWASCDRSANGSGPFSVGGILNAVTRYRRFRNDACILHVGAPQNFQPTTVDQIASFVSMDADGFTINWTAAGADSGGNGMVSQYIALKAVGGNAQFKCGVGTQGDTTITAGFRPDAMMFGSAITPNNNIDTIYGANAYGITDGTQQYSGWCGGVTGNVAGPNGDWWGISYFSTTSCIRWDRIDKAAPTTAIPVAEATAALTGTGANLTWSTDDGGGNKFGWIAFQTQNSVVNNAPTVVTLPASNVTGATATLNGTITPNQVAAVYYRFNYGLTTAYGLHSPTSYTVDGSGFTPTALSANVTGLSPGATYHFQLCASRDSAGTCLECDDDREFVAGAGFVFRNRFRAEQ